MRIRYKDIVQMNCFRKVHSGYKENAVDTSKKSTGKPVSRNTTNLPESEASTDRLREIRTEAVKADVLEGFAEIDRGEVVNMTLDDLSREVERCRLTHTNRS